MPAFLLAVLLAVALSPLVLVGFLAGLTYNVVANGFLLARDFLDYLAAANDAMRARIDAWLENEV